MSALLQAADRLEGRDDSPRSRRARLLREHPTTLAFAQHFDYTVKTTPALAVIDAALDECEQAYAGRLVITMPPQEGKLVAHSTPVPTPTGWTTHGQLRVGDLVLHPSGRPTRVRKTHPEAQAWLKVRTTDHAEILVHPRHEWTVYDRSAGRWRTVETGYLMTQALSSGTPEERGHRYRFQLPFREALQLPDIDLPIDPYTLGVWLGDGRSTGAAIYHHADDDYLLAYPNTARCVHAGTGVVTDYYGGGLHADLRAAGLLGNKHVPARYLRASEKQRRALLAGLVDTDGHVATSGQVSFDNANEQLVRDTAELLRTLGYRAHVHRPTEPKLSSSGIQGKQQMWRVTYTPHDEGPARLTRKAAVTLGTRRRAAIMSIEEVAPEPGRCITVDAEDGLYLVGEAFTPTHNTTTLRFFCARALNRNPDLRIAYVSYAALLARASGRYVRGLIETHGDEMGLSLSRDHSDASDWSLQGHRGGMASVGIGGALTGRPVDLLIIDDPLRNRQDADSELILTNQEDWWLSVARTRLAPAASVIITQTRWNERDLAGNRIADGWKQVNIPALADGDTVDALGREPGTYLESSRARTPADWRAARKDVGERVWAALYQGRPAPPEGTNFKRAWIERNRLDRAPDLSRIEVFVDPADNEGGGDEAGIIVGGRAQDSYYLLADRSGHMTVNRWFRVALIAALEFGCTAIRYEQSLSSLAKRGRQAWKDLKREALVLNQLPTSGGELTASGLRAAIAQLARGDEDPDELAVLERNLRELWPHLAAVLRLPVTGIPMRKYISKGTKTFRAQMVSPLYEGDHVHHVGRFPELEHQMTTWQEGQDSPDRMDALVSWLTESAKVSGENRMGGRNEERHQLPQRLGVGRSRR